uniref:G_PROTEIN_RECEP_F1_2 domain-containing protein n=1 Tax=Steinernema glaseri TaxID=37863 RepID=A0A1I7ZJ59_9BILA
MVRCVYLVLNINSYIAGFFSLSLNVLLFAMILKWSVRNLARYRGILAFNCTVDILFAVLSSLTNFTYLVTDSTMILFSTGPIVLLGQSMGRALLCLQDSMIFLAIVVVPISYIFRYFVIVRRMTMKSSYVFLMASVSLLSFVGFFASVYIVIENNFSKYEEHRRIVAEEMGIEDQKKIVLMAGDVLNLDMQICLLYLYTFVIISYTAMCFCTKKILKVLRESRGLSDHCRKLQNQLTAALFVQALVPLVLLVVPCLFLLVSVLVDSRLGLSVQLGSALLAWLPALNATVTLCIVSPYRKGVKGLLKKKMKMKISQYLSNQNGYM